MDPNRLDSFARFKNPRAPYLQPSSDSFGLTEALSIERSFLVTARRLRTQLFHLVNDRAAGNLSLQGFVTKSRAAIRSAYFAAYALGAISLFPFYTLTDKDVRILDEELDTETGFLRKLGSSLDGGNLYLSPIQRAGLYLLALRGMFEKGRTEAMPAGPYKWKLGQTEHCIECLNTSLGGPYQRERYSGLGLPELPGNPGDGSICLGLTRCGCTIELATGIPLPNQDLPIRIRALLLEVVYGTSPVTSRATAE